MTDSTSSDPFSVLNQVTATGVDDVEHRNVMLLLTKTSFTSDREAAKNEQKGSILTEKPPICIYNVNSVHDENMQNFNRLRSNTSQQCVRVCLIRRRLGDYDYDT
ncbi:hypothetical protein DPMN_142688 [Dreissena polymorpha]|uniref:Uncharacterized protein n=1 Tax=Dreissena polymorpha TaxID=45954 RepID=A0A9D4GBR0_DREPO|nr:hypothetical protein DPMN_142688 [Dreissena polymorpha]